MSDEEKFENIVLEIVDILNGPDSPTILIASADNVVYQLRELLELHSDLEEKINSISNII